MASAEKSEEDIEKDFLTKECKKQFRVIDEIISRNEDPHDSVEGNDALREIEQAKLRVKQSMAKHAAHGILLFADQEWVTALNLISKSANHIEVSVKLKNRSFELLVIYGPPSNAKKNNTFYETVGTNFFDKNKNKPAIAIGDTNALVDIIKDRKPAKKMKTTKTALALLVKSKGLIDLGRITAPAKSPEWTYEKNIQGGIKLKERLDYAISNAKFWTNHPETVVETDVIMPNMDHAAIEIHFSADDKLEKRNKAVRYRRKMNDEQRKELLDAIHEIPREQENPTQSIAQIDNAIRKMLKEHLQTKIARNAPIFSSIEQRKAQNAVVNYEQIWREKK